MLPSVPENSQSYLGAEVIGNFAKSARGVFFLKKELSDISALTNPKAEGCSPDF